VHIHSKTGAGYSLAETISTTYPAMAIVILIHQPSKDALGARDAGSSSRYKRENE
jgi:hypothetical protein